MLNHYLKIAIRGLWHNKTYSSMNLFGLTIGIASVLLVFFYVKDELSYDHFHENANQIYRVNGVSINPEGDFYRTILPPPVGLPPC